MRAAIIVLGFAGMFACQRPVNPGPPEPIVYLRSLKITDRTPTSTRPVSLDQKLLRTTIQTSFRAAGMTVPGPGFPSPEQWAEFVDFRKEQGKPKPGTVWPVRVELAVIYGLQAPDGVASKLMDGPGKVVLVGDASIRLPGQTESVHERFQIGDGGQFKGDESAYRASLERWLAQVAKKVGGRVVNKVQLFELPLTELVMALADKDRARRLDAAERVAMLRHRPAVEPLAKRLTTESDREVKLRVVGALAEIGDDRAAKALIAAADPRDRELLRAIVDALSVIGGARVLEFFQIMSMHDSIEVRDLVEDAIKRLERRGLKGQDKTRPRSPSESR